MITELQSATVHVSDQDRAIAFYTDVLGFRLEQDNPMSDGVRWVAVTPPRGGAALILAKGFGGWSKDKVGRFTGLVLAVDSMYDTAHALKERGVRFDMEPEQQMWGMQAVIADPDGNTMVLHSMEGIDFGDVA
jgi:predicted enzyme related to lactoylglutathione lyase